MELTGPWATPFGVGKGPDFMYPRWNAAVQSISWVRTKLKAATAQFVVLFGPQGYYLLFWLELNKEWSLKSSSRWVVKWKYTTYSKGLPRQPEKWGGGCRCLQVRGAKV